MNENNKNGCEVIRDIANDELCSINAKKDEKIYKLLDIFENLPEPLQNKMLEEIINTADAQTSESLEKNIDNAQVFSQGQG